MAERVCILLSFLITTNVVFCQASTVATASATIVTPVSTESREQQSSATFSLSPTSKPIFLRPFEKNNFSKESFPGTQNPTKEIASIKLWNNNYSFAVMPHEHFVINRFNGKESLMLKNIEARILTNEKEINAALISVSASLEMQPWLVPGYYYSAKPLELIINFD